MQSRTSNEKMRQVSAQKGRLFLSLAKLNCQLALGRLDLVQLVLPLAAHGVLQPSYLVLFSIAGGGGTAVSAYRLESLVEEVCVLVVLGGLFGDFGEGARLGDGD